MKIKIIWLLGAIALCFLAGLIGSIATYPSIPTWYAFLNKPFFSPPSWVFGPVWTVLYIMMGVSLYLILEKREKIKGKLKKEMNKALFLFGSQLALNSLWSILFFGLRSPLYGVLCIVPLLILVLATILQFHKFSKTAAYLLVPYLLWGCFATILNLSILLLN